MIIVSANQKIAAQIVGAGGPIQALAYWKIFGSDGRFVQHGLLGPTAVSSSQIQIVPATAVDGDATAIKEITGIWLPNNEANLAAADVQVKVFLENSVGGFSILWNAILPSRHTAHYSPALGWLVYDEFGIQVVGNGYTTLDGAGV